MGVPLTVLEGFRERSFGAWEGLTSEEAGLSTPQAFRHFQESDGQTAPPGGESVDEVRGRVQAAWAGWVRGAVGGQRLLVTHAGVMRVLLMDLIGLPAHHAWRIALPEAAHFQVSLLEGHPPVLLNLNSCAV